MDLAYSQEHETYRDEVRSFLEHNKDQAPRRDGGLSAQAWQQLLIEHGYGARTIPREYGGAGEEPDILKSHILAEEFAHAKVPPGHSGDNRIVPVLLEMGTQEQKQRFIGPTVRGEMSWCQGYSEPNAGSDLASLQTKAHVDGDDFVINGQKIWTSGAHVANMIFALVRTDPEAPKHRGITYLLASMESPGIEVRPLVQMSDAQGFNEVFFEDVRVPVKNAVGEIDRGWYVGATHLDFERSSIGNAVGQQRMLDGLRGFLQEERDAGSGRSRLGQPGAPRTELADRYIEAAVAKTLSQRVISMQSRGLIPNYEASMTKVFSTEFNQRIARTATKLLGKYGDIRDRENKWSPMRGRWATMYLSSVSSTIAGGTSEIQRNVIATRGLGLPRG